MFYWNLLNLLFPNIEVFNHLTNALENHTKISRILNLDTGEISADDHSGEDAVIMENKKMTHSPQSYVWVYCY
ncbi:MAG: hypothetical protein Ct9H300mP22_3680 [Gammaproteobacteria bacterium]|nr:MAG: hypothetical protein Ct9H300mP22_3680 [Gammaproteobacteria bacterium]